MTLNSICDGPYRRISSEFDSIRSILMDYDSLNLSSNRSVKREIALVKAFSYVWIQAEVERFVKDTLHNLILDINRLAIKISDARLCLISIAQSPKLHSLKDVSGLKMWQRRVEILISTSSDDNLNISIEDMPTDGRTIRPEHFQTIWSTFGFSGNHLPSPRHALALNDLAEGRNAIAHGDSLPDRFGRGKVALDIVRLIDLAEEVIANYIEAIERYFKKQEFLR